MSLEQENFVYLNASVYLMNCCWREFQGFCGNNLLWAYNHVDASCMITSSEQGNFCFTSIYLINFRRQEFLDFCGTNHVIYEPKITWMLIACWRLQNRDILNRLFFWMLIASVYFMNCCWYEIQSFCWSNHIWAYNETDAYSAMTSSK